MFKFQFQAIASMLYVGLQIVHEQMAIKPLVILYTSLSK